MDTERENPTGRLSGVAVLKGAALVLCALVLLRHAWVSDDAFITLRTVRNLVEGEGPRWNLHERVQGFTHPLWMLLLSLSYGLSREPMVAALSLSLALSLITLHLVAFRLRLPAPAALLAMACMVSSKSFVDYSTSGLENPLTHLLFVLLVAEHVRGREGTVGDPESESRRRALRVTVLAGLLALNRLDTMLVSLPFVLSAYWRLHDTFRGAGKTLVLGFAPLLTWEVFTVIYYGFPFPNTAYSKLAGGVASSDLGLQGAGYFLTQMAFDPTSLLVIGCALVLLGLQRESRWHALGLAIVLDLVYVVRIGGDFMAGRFFTLPLLAGALLLALLLREHLACKSAAAYLPAAVVMAAGLVMTPHPTLGADVDYAPTINPISNNPWDERGIADERAFYASNSALSRARRGVLIPDDARRERGEAMAASDVRGAVGQLGVTSFFAPPTAIIVDDHGLTDALVVRLPVVDKKNWRIGHFRRDIPAGYLESLSQGRNLVADERIARLYDQVKRVVSGPVWNWERWKDIVRLNFGMAPPAPDKAL